MSIECRALTFAYGEAPVLRGIDLCVRPGERIGIVGESGGGKSTLLKLLAGLYAQQAGTIEVCGAQRPRDIRQHVAAVMQGAPLLPVSIRENITCGHAMAEGRIRRAVEAAQLAAWVDGLPDGLDTFVGERGGQVSGGQAQRIAIARAIARDVPVLLLDEATSALDADTGGAVLEALEAAAREKAVVSVSHHARALQGYARVYRLEGGRLHDL